MNLIQDVLAASAGGQESLDRFTRVPLTDILPDEQNFYGLREIEELAAAIDAYGLDQPLVVRPADKHPGKYILTGGHRRRAALLRLANKDPKRWAEVDVKITASLGFLADRARLIVLNKTARKETEYEQMREVVELAEIAKEWKARGGNVSGKLREAVAQSVGLSSAQVGKYQAIYNHLIPSLMRSYEVGNIGTPTAYELSSLPKRQQEEIAANSLAPTLEQVKAKKTASKPATPTPTKELTKPMPPAQPSSNPPAGPQAPTAPKPCQPCQPTQPERDEYKFTHTAPQEERKQPTKAETTAALPMRTDIELFTVAQNIVRQFNARFTAEEMNRINSLLASMWNRWESTGGWRG